MLHVPGIVAPRAERDGLVAEPRLARPVAALAERLALVTVRVRAVELVGLRERRVLGHASGARRGRGGRAAGASAGEPKAEDEGGDRGEAQDQLALRRASRSRPPDTSAAWISESIFFTDSGMAAPLAMRCISCPR
jgi:hypothetical protein